MIKTLFDFRSLEAKNRDRKLTNVGSGLGRTGREKRPTELATANFAVT